MAKKNQSDVDYRKLRQQMVEEQVVRRGIKSKRVIKALSIIPRQKFVPPKLREESYDDCPLPIGFKQTISQPYIVALMTETLSLENHHSVLEIGTGSGYQTSVLALLARSVTSVEIIPELHEKARQILKILQLKNINLLCGDACETLVDDTIYDRIIVTAAAESIPRNLINRLKNNGKLVIPIGKNNQQLKMVVRSGSRIEIFNGPGVRFVPITGQNFEKSITG
ncbi:MAG: protein-L-isoaspartate(D-aspartate) O-methyltransferase [Calditrichaeota bacterium]|nr:MAG: protein-L-isoaspartate(D-aspartate) O-methyltransferase [Calditrichota bacterium]